MGNEHVVNTKPIRVTVALTVLTTLLINAGISIVNHWDLDVAFKWAQIVIAMATAITLLVVVGGVILTRRQLHYLELERKGDLHLRLYDIFRSMDADRVHIRVLAEQGIKIQPNIPKDLTNPQYATYVRLSTFFEMTAVLVERGAIDQQLVDETFKPSLIRFVETARPLIDDIRCENHKILEHRIKMYEGYKVQET